MSADTLGLSEMDIMLVTITTVDGVEPTFDIVSTPNGKMLDNVVEAPGRMVITLRDKVLYDSGEYEAGKSGMSIRVRGNSSAIVYDKKPYNLKLEKKSDLLQRNKEKYKSKHWLLLLDGPKVQTFLALFLSRQLDFHWTPSCTFANVVVNGDYRGLYHLIESVKAEDGRIDLDDETGFMVEHDNYYWKENFYIESIWGERQHFTLKYPDDDALDDADTDYIRQTLQQMQSSMDDGTYADCIDLPSFAKYLLGQDILGSSDHRGSNKYVAKYDNTADTRVFMPCMWDFNDNMSISPDEFAPVHTGTPYFFSHMLTSSPALLEEYIRQWKQLKAKGFEQQIFDVIDSLDHIPNKTDIEASARLDRQRYENVPYVSTLNRLIQRARTWYTERLVWLDDTIHRLDVATDIDAPHIEAHRTSPLYYNLQGIAQSEPYDGLNIVVDEQGRRRKVYIR